MNDRLCKKYFGDFSNLNSRKKRKRAIQRINAQHRLNVQEIEKLSAELEKKRQKDEAKRLKRNSSYGGCNSTALLELGESERIGTLLDRGLCS